jgi:PHP domain
MHIRGALHMHSTLSRDGTLTIAELTEWYVQKGYQFIAITEHAEDMNESKVLTLREDGLRNSSSACCVISGLEFACTGNTHIPGIGVTDLIPERDPVHVVEEIHKRAGFAILAHPKKMKWVCPPEVIRVVDAVEIWNVGSDGKFLPAARALRTYRDMQTINPKLLAIAAHDFHRKGGFYDVALEMQVPALTRESIISNLHQGLYTIKSRFFQSDSHAEVIRPRETSLAFLSRQLSALRKVRSILMPWSS